MTTLLFAVVAVLVPAIVVGTVVLAVVPDEVGQEADRPAGAEAVARS